MQEHIVEPVGNKSSKPPMSPQKVFFLKSKLLRAMSQCIYKAINVSNLFKKTKFDHVESLRLLKVWKFVTNALESIKSLQIKTNHLML